MRLPRQNSDRQVWLDRPDALAELYCAVALADNAERELNQILGIYPGSPLFIPIISSGFGILD